MTATAAAEYGVSQTSGDAATTRRLVSDFADGLAVNSECPWCDEPWDDDHMVHTSDCEIGALLVHVLGADTHRASRPIRTGPTP